MFSKLLNWKVFGGLLLVGIITTGYYKLQYDAAQATVEGQKTEISNLETEKKRLQGQLNQLEKDITTQINKTYRLNEKVAELQSEKRELSEELEGAKGRQELVWQKPKLVERFFRRNWQDRVDDMSCAMGVLEKCSNEYSQD